MMAGWTQKKLSQVCEKITDGTHQTPTYYDEGVIFLSSRNVTSGKIDWENIKYIDTKQHLEMHKRLAPRINDVLLAKNGTTGVAAIVDRDVVFDIYVSLALLRPLDMVLPNFLLYFINSPLAKKQFTKRLKGIGVPNLHLEEIRKVEIPFPESKADQQRIVTILDEAFDGIATAKANAEKNLQNARALFESHLHGVDDEKVPLGELVDIRTGKLDANAAVEGGIYPFFTCSRDVYAIDNYAFDCEAILLAGNNAVGDFNVKHYSGKFNAYQRTYVITVNEQQRVLYRFLYFQMLKSLRKFKDQSVGAGTKFLKLGMIKEMEIALPSLADQHKIVATMDSVREETEHLESIYQQKLVALDALKKSLLDQAFKGEL